MVIWKIWACCLDGIAKHTGRHKYGQHTKRWSQVKRTFSTNFSLSPLYIKLGVIKQFIKALLKTNDSFKYICTKISVFIVGKTKKKKKFCGPIYIYQWNAFKQTEKLNWLPHKHKSLLFIIDLIFFFGKLGTTNEKQGKRFHKDIKAMEKIWLLG